MSARYSLITLLMLAAIVAATTNLAVVLYKESLPIEWDMFTMASAEEISSRRQNGPFLWQCHL